MKNKQQSDYLPNDTASTQTMNVSTAILDLKGATCTSCAIAIEHLGRRLKPINEIYVDRSNSTIHVSFTGDDSVLSQLCDFVKKIGYHASVRELSKQSDNTNQ